MRKGKTMKALIAGIAVITGAVGSVLPISDSAAQMYRCGNLYQSQPCDGNLSAKPVSGLAHSSNSTASTTHASKDPACAQRGVESQKVVWAREGGMTQEEAIAEESNPARRKLIADVYQVRGAAPEVRARIEAECKAEMEERAKAIAIHQSMVKAGVMPGAQPASGGSSGADIAQQPAATEKHALLNEQRSEAGALKARCDRINERLTTIRRLQHAKMTGAEMDHLNRERSDLDSDVRRIGCS